jgi:probable F420-dependent oxidoreductase
MDLGRFGIWWSGWQEDDGYVRAAAEMEEVGYGTLWMSGGFVPGVPKRIGELLAATTRITVATGITNVWINTASEAAALATSLEEEHGGRFLLGLGVSHAAIVEANGQPYVHPLGKMREFLDELDADGRVGKPQRILAALGRNMLGLAAERSLGAHPYFSTVEHTAFARAILGPSPILAPEVAVVVSSDPAEARGLARRYMELYMSAPNYVNNLLSLGWTTEDFENGGSDAFVDALIPWGDVESIAERLEEHREAGADHVCVQIVTETGMFPLADYRELAIALGL